MDRKGSTHRTSLTHPRTIPLFPERSLPPFNPSFPSSCSVLHLSFCFHLFFSIFISFPVFLSVPLSLTLLSNAHILLFQLLFPLLRRSHLLFHFSLVPHDKQVLLSLILSIRSPFAFPPALSLLSPVLFYLGLYLYLFATPSRFLILQKQKQK